MNEWMNHPAMENMDPIKLELIRTAAMQSAGKSGSGLASVLMPLIASANRKGISFSPDEISLVLEIMKEGKSEKEKQQIDSMVKMITSYMQKNHPGGRAQ